MEEKAQRKKDIIVDIVMLDRKPDEKLPDMAVYLISPAGAVVKKLAVVKKNRLQLEEEWKNLGRVIALGPDVDELQKISAESLLQFRLEAVWPQWESLEVVNVPREWWLGWLWQRVCVSGSVRRCFPAILPPINGSTTDYAHTGTGFVSGTEIPVGTATFLQAELQSFPEISSRAFRKCFPLCHGVVEVYERVCCCRPWVVLDLRLEELLRRLRDIVKPWQWPPFPPVREAESGAVRRRIPDPWLDPASPIDRIALRQLKLRQALTDPAAKVSAPVRLIEDLRVLEASSRQEACQYVAARPYLQSLLCTCRTRKLGEAILGPDGSFTFCYSSPVRVVVRGTMCTRIYAYKVKQWRENQWIYVYDGLAAPEYFAEDEVANLITYNPRARPCDTDPPPVDHPKPFVLLESIGTTDSYRLVSPMQNSDSAIDTSLPANAGLVNPPPVGQDALGKLFNQPWSKTLAFRLHVDPDMQSLGAHYYRISTVAIDDMLGKPVSGAIPQPLSDAVSWLHYVYVDGQVQVQGETLGPHAITDPGGTVQSGLYEIPYWETHQWQHGQFHHYWDTELETDGKYLVILEIFDSAGSRLRPIGASGDGVDKDFDFLRRTDTDTTTPVPYASLLHVFWVNKKHCYAKIEDLRRDRTPSGEECQFMSGVADCTFSAGFRAFHIDGPPREPFIWYYTLEYHRGLNGPDSTIQTSGENAPPTDHPAADSAAVSTTQTFASMLEGHEKCTFALNLKVYAKHTNGSRRISEYDEYEQAAFALEVVMGQHGQHEH